MDEYIKKTKFKIGDLVKPNEKAHKRNREFSSDRRFMITAIDNSKLFNSLDTWYKLATKDSEDSRYCLPENELELVKSFEWVF